MILLECIRRFALIAARNAKFPLSRRAIDQFIAMIVLEARERAEILAVVDQVLVVGDQVLLMVAEEEAISEETTLGINECIQRPALVAERDARFHSSRQAESQFIAAIVLKETAMAEMIEAAIEVETGVATGVKDRLQISWQL
jgi:hypothetical protein